MRLLCCWCAAGFLHLGSISALFLSLFLIDVGVFPPSFPLFLLLPPSTWWTGLPPVTGPEKATKDDGEKYLPILLGFWLEGVCGCFLPSYAYLFFWIFQRGGFVCTFYVPSPVFATGECIAFLI